MRNHFIFYAISYHLNGFAVEEGRLKISLTVIFVKLHLFCKDWNTIIAIYQRPLSLAHIAVFLWSCCEEKPEYSPVQPSDHIPFHMPAPGGRIVTGHKVIQPGSWAHVTLSLSQISKQRNDKTKSVTLTLFAPLRTLLILQSICVALCIQT